MSWQAVTLILTAAVAHALWNLHAKQAAPTGVAFLWLTSAFSVTLYMPLALWQLVTVGVNLSPAVIAAFLGSVAAHTAYIGFLQRGYAIGDLSLVYPVARGLGPVLAIVGALVVLGERPGMQIIVGGLIVCASVASSAVIGVGWRSQLPQTRAFAYAGLTGLAIACYTLIDAHAVTTLAIPPLVFTWSGSLLRLCMYTSIIWTNRQSPRAVWAEHRRNVLAVAFLSPLAYVLVLLAFQLAPVSQVAPLREMSILFGTVLGTRLLAEAHGRARLLAATAVVFGVLLVVTG